MLSFTDIIFNQINFFFETNENAIDPERCLCTFCNSNDLSRSFPKIIIVLVDRHHHLQLVRLVFVVVL